MGEEILATVLLSLKREAESAIDTEEEPCRKRER